MLPVCHIKSAAVLVHGLDVLLIPGSATGIFRFSISCIPSLVVFPFTRLTSALQRLYLATLDTGFSRYHIAPLRAVRWLVSLLLELGLHPVLYQVHLEV